MFERLRAALEAALDAATPPADVRAMAGRMREAVVEMRVAVARMRDAIPDTERQLADEHRQLDDAERRGRLAGGIGDAETVEVAGRFAAKHRERVMVLEQKLAAQRAELTLAQKEEAEMLEQMKALGGAAAQAAGSAERAWQHLDRAGAARPETDLSQELLKTQMDRAERDARAEEQLKELKKRMGK